MPYEREDDNEDEGIELPDGLIPWLERLAREEIRAFFDWLWEDGGLKEVVKDAVREGTAEAVEDVASKQPWRQMLGGTQRPEPRGGLR